MRVLVLYAHPSETSFVAALHRETCATLAARGHEVDNLDLYAEGFDPVLSRETYRHYLDPKANRAEVGAYVDRLLAADALVLIYPVWHDGLPAIMKGFIDRVFLRGVVFDIDEHGVFRPLLSHVKRLTAVATYGADRHRTLHVGDLTRRFVTRNLGPLIAEGTPIEYLADYGMDRSTPVQRERFLKRTIKAFSRW